MGRELKFERCSIAVVGTRGYGPKLSVAARLTALISS
jgi:hypothetical protein